MRMCVALLATALAVVVTVVSSGCGPSIPAHLPVRGKITVAGGPLTAGRIVFAPDTAKGNTHGLEAAGTVDAQGNYELETREAKGAPAGWYQVTVFARQPSPPGEMAPPVWLANQKYTSAASSGLAVEVSASAPANAYDFALEK